MKQLELNMKTAKELNKELGGGEYEGVPMSDLIGKKIIVTGGETKLGEFGEFWIMNFKLGSKELSTPTGSRAITKLLENGKFPFEGKIVQLRSKKVNKETKKKELYYAFD